MVYHKSVSPPSNHEGQAFEAKRTEIADSALVANEQPNIPLLLQLWREQASQFKPKIYFQDVGTVQQVGNGVATLSGLPHARTDELVIFPTGVAGLVLNLDRHQVDVILLGSDEDIQGGDLVIGSGKRLQVPVGPDLLGRVVNPLGQPLDEKGPIDATAHQYLEQPAPGIIERAPVSEPLHTGQKIVDALVPIGRGQRELIIGDRQTGKTTLAVDTILNQHSSDVKCIYVGIGQKKSSALGVINTLRQNQALAYTTVVLSSPDDPPALRYLAPYAGCTMAEFLMREGHDVLIIYDDLSKHADAYRELSLLLRRPPGREAYPGDIFYLHARLLERACKLNPASGGTSLTALPIIQVQRGNISAYIPTNLISITDGQIVLDTDRFNRGVKPALDVGRSVSRVGGAAQTHAMRTLASHLRLELAQFEEVAHFARFGAELDEATQHQINRGRRLQAALTQMAYQPLDQGLQLIALFAVTNGLLDSISITEIPQFERDLLAHFATDHPKLIGRLTTGEALNDKTSLIIENEINSYKALWLNKG